MEKKTSKRGDLSAFAIQAGISVGYAHQLLSDPGSANYKVPPIETALAIYRRTGRKLGILTDASTREANALVKLAERSGSIPVDEQAMAG